MFAMQVPDLIRAQLAVSATAADGSAVDATGLVALWLGLILAVRVTCAQQGQDTQMYKYLIYMQHNGIYVVAGECVCIFGICIRM